MKKLTKPFLVLICSALIICLALAVYTGVSRRRHWRDKFSQYEPSCTAVSEYILGITPSGGEYYLQDTGGGYVLINKGENGRAETGLPPDIQADMADLEQAFYKMTHRYGLEWISVSDDCVIYSEMSYGGCLIYCRDGKLDRDIKDQRVTEGYQRLIRLDDRWYSVHIRLR